MRDRTTHRDSRVPVQERSIKTRERILKAALRLFTRKGYHGTNSNQIAAAAGVSTGSFYAYFRDKKTLFLETLKKFNRDALARIQPGQEPAEDGAAGGDPGKLVRALINRAMAAHDYSPAFHREATAMIYSDDDAFAVQSEEDARVMDAVAAAFEQYRDSLRVRDTHAAAVVLFRATEGVIHQLALAGNGMDRDAVLEELADMLQRYLLNDKDAGHGRGPDARK